MLKSYLPILVFAALGLGVGTAFVLLNHVIGPKKPARPTAASRRQGEPYESGIPVAPAPPGCPTRRLRPDGGSPR